MTVSKEGCLQDRKEKNKLVGNGQLKPFKEPTAAILKRGRWNGRTGDGARSGNAGGITEST